MSFKGHGEIAIITSLINATVYIELLHNFLFPSKDNWFGGDEVFLDMFKDILNFLGYLMSKPSL